MSIYINLDLKVVSPNRAQAFAAIRLVRKVEGGTEYLDIGKGTSGLLSDVPPNELLKRAAADALADVEDAAKAAREHLAGMGLL